MLVTKYHDGNCEDKEILVAIDKAIKSSLQLRLKKELIENFIKFVENAFRDVVLKTTGTDVDRLMPPVSRFGGGSRDKKKLTIIEKLKVFFEKYFGLVSLTWPTAESKTMNYDYTARQPPLEMVAEGTQGKSYSS